MPAPFKGTDKTTVNLSDGVLDLLRKSFGSDQLNVQGEIAELVAQVDGLLATAQPGPLSLSHDELAIMHSICKKTLYAKERRADAATLMRTVREGFESFYKG